MKRAVVLLAFVLLVAGCTSSPAPATGDTNNQGNGNPSPTPSPPAEEPFYTTVITSAPASIGAGDQIDVSWSVSGPAARSSHTDVWYDTQSHPGPFANTVSIEEAGYASQTVTAFDNGADVPDVFSGHFPAPASGTVFYRALAMVDNKYYWSPEGRIQVIAAAPPTDDVAEFSVSASQFAFSPGVIQVKKGQKVKVALSTDDVTHGFAISEFGVNQVISPGSPTSVEFTADTVGSFPIICSVPCGSGHGGMRGTLVVTE